MNDGWFICWEDGCRIHGIRQWVRRPMTGREGFQRHHRTTHPGDKL